MVEDPLLIDRCSSARRTSSTTAVIAYGISPSSSATVACVARHSASRNGTSERPRSVRLIRRVRASGPGSEVIRSSLRMAAMVWLIAECERFRDSASSRMVSGPVWASRISGYANRGRTPLMPRST